MIVCRGSSEHDQVASLLTEQPTLPKISCGIPDPTESNPKESIPDYTYGRFRLKPYYHPINQRSDNIPVNNVSVCKKNLHGKIVK